MDMLGKLGFQLWKFSFIIVNFLLLYFLLKKLFFKKLMDIMEERRQNVANAVAKIDKAKSEVEVIIKEGEVILVKAKDEAKLIVKKAKTTADDIMAEAKAESDKYIKETRESIEREREEIRQEMYSTLIDLVSMASRKVMSRVISEQDQQKLVETAVRESWKQKSVKGSNI
jgi:F-type H+-transporting ATPase subunit b